MAETEGTNMTSVRVKCRWSVGIIAMVFVLGIADWKTGYELNFFVFYFVPVSISAWCMGFAPAVLVAVLSSLVWFAAGALAGQVFSSHFFAVWNTGVRMISFLIIGWAVSVIRARLDPEREAAEQLRKALSEVKVLGALLPICAQCKKIRDEKGVWHALESYIGQRSNTQFSHGYCPECYRRALNEAGLTGERSSS